MEDHVRPLGDELCGLAGLGEIRRDGADLERRVRGRLRLDDVVQRRLRDLAPAEPAVLRQPLRELAPDHAGRAEDEDVHVGPRRVIPGVRSATRDLLPNQAPKPA
jgi:hypothetical protein